VKRSLRFVAIMLGTFLGTAAENHLLNIYPHWL
jgi:hypothetical protein